ncbi:MAG TPA: TetR family transcriptional regulator [Microlunatus sp.]
MAGRRELILDSALGIAGEQGLHRMTHRAVDAAAGLPLGSTSNYFRTREDLLTAVIERFAQLERGDWDDIAAVSHPVSAAELSGVMAEWVRGAVGAHRSVTVARYGFLVQAALDPSWQRLLAPGADRVNTWATNWFRTVGSAAPERDAQMIMAMVDGMVLHQLSHPDPAFDPYVRLRTLIDTLIPPVTTGERDGRERDLVGDR